MSQINWLDTLGWNEDQLDDLRFVAYSYIKQGKYEIALSFFEALVVLSKNNAYDLQTLGALYLQMGNNVSALNYLEQALKVDPEHEPTLLNRTKSLFLLGYKRQAFDQARYLEEKAEKSIADAASALIMAYS
ncbi:MAG: tetratricopeptide repeat protein [Chlamydiia bacterium]|nr:tetratricopeptide repeat protein [Chlamydiia bacterium]MCP5491474.1 tetratricopeptide repeat protein [Chlamydiales bacterium]